MGTSFDEIYTLNNVIKSDSRLNLLSIDDYYFTLWQYLQLAISDFSYDCTKNLNNNVPFSRTMYTYTCNGTDTIFSLGTIPMQTDIKFYIYYKLDSNSDLNEILEYAYDSNNYTITLNDVLPENAILTIISYEIGKFNVVLTYDEKRILSEAMILPFLEEQANEVYLLRYTVYGGSQKQYSQSEHIKNISEKVLNQRNLIDKLITRYSYKTNNTNLLNLGGRYYVNTD